MEKNPHVSPQYETSVNACSRRLLAATGDAKLQAAEQLNRLGVWTRGSLRPRGTLVRPAENRLPVPGILPGIVKSLEDPRPDIRCEIVTALGEWGGDEVVRSLVETFTRIQTRMSSFMRLRH